MASSTTSTVDQAVTSGANIPPYQLRINEIVSNPATGMEWVELYNTGTTTISSTVILADGAGPIATVPIELPSSSFFVYELSSSKLNNHGDIIALLYGTTTLDSVAYGDWPGSVIAAPKKNQSLIRFSDGLEQIYITTRATRRSENILQEPIISTTKDTSDNHETYDSHSKEETPTPQSYMLEGKIHISEILPNPVGSDSDDEFIELFNADTKTLNIEGWRLGDGSTKKFVIPNIEVKTGEYIVFYRSDSKLALNNSGEEVVTLYAPDERIVDSVTYSGSVQENLSYARHENTFSWTELPTPGEKNSILISVTATQEETEDPIPTSSPIVTKASETLYSLDDQAVLLELSEFLPNPKGAEDGEFIELYNPLATSIDLSLLKLDDEESGSRPYTIPEGTILPPLSYRSFPRTETTIALNNTGDAVRLLLPDGSVIASVSYDAVIEGASYVKNTQDTWVMTLVPTPNKENIIQNPEDKFDTSNKRERSVVRTTLHDLRIQDIGELVTVTGTVAVLPGILGSQYFYIVGSPGVQIYNFKKDFPELAVGDIVEVTGELTEINGETRLKLTDAKALTVIAEGEPPEPQKIEVIDTGEKYEGWLTQVSGEITEKKSSYLWLDDGTDEIKVYIKKGTSISIKDIAVGDTMRITGILSQTKAGYQLLPRSQDDLKLEEKNNAVVTAEQSTPNKKEHITLYLGVLIGGLVMIFMALIIKHWINTMIK